MGITWAINSTLSQLKVVASHVR